jgi:hypothetical protein
MSQYAAGEKGHYSKLRQEAVQYVYVVYEGQSIHHQLQLLVKLREKEGGLCYPYNVFLTSTTITCLNFNGFYASDSVKKGGISGYVNHIK